MKTLGVLLVATIVVAVGVASPSFSDAGELSDSDKNKLAKISANARIAGPVTMILGFLHW